MALPQYWLSNNRKDLAEKAIVSRRQREAHSAQRRESAARYHRDLNLLSSQYRNIEEGISGKTPRINRESFLDEEAKAKRKEKLFQRQHKLMLLFAQENEKYLRELKAMSEEECHKDPWNIATLKEQIEELKRRRKHDEEALTKRSTTHLYRGRNSPFFDEREVAVVEKEVQKAWEQKKKELEKQATEQIEEDKQKMFSIEQQALAAKKNAEEAACEKRDTARKWTEKIDELSAHTQEAVVQKKKLESENNILESYLQLVASVVKKRNEVKKIQKERIAKIEMFRKSKEKVRKLAHEIRHIMEIDLATLDFLHELKSTDKENTVDLDLSSVGAAIKSVKEAISQQDKQDAELHVMFEEEATRSLNSRKQIWDDSLEVHEKTMCHVFDELNGRIKRRLDENLNALKQSKEICEDLIISTRECKEKAVKDVENIQSKHEYYVNKVKHLEEELKIVTADSAKTSKIIKK